MNRIFYKTQLEEYIWRHSCWYAQRENIIKTVLFAVRPFLLASPSNVKLKKNVSKHLQNMGVVGY